MKRLVVKTGEYTNANGETKGRYQNIGRLLSGENGEFIILDVDFDLSGLLFKQNLMNREKGQQIRDGLMVSIFSDDNQQQRSQQNPQQNPQQGYNNQPQKDNSFDEDIPF